MFPCLLCGKKYIRGSHHECLSLLVTSPPEHQSGLKSSSSSALSYDSEESKLEKEWVSLSFSRSPSLSLSKSASLSHSPEPSPWPCLILNEYQIYKSSSSSSSTSGTAPAAVSSSSSSSLSSSLASTMNLSSSLRKSQESTEETEQQQSIDFPSRLSDCKEYVDTDIVDMLSPALDSDQVKPSSATTTTSITPYSAKSSNNNSSNHHQHQNHESSGSSEDDDEEGTRKLFIGRVPKCLTADDLLQFFTQYGAVVDVDLSPERGCSFVTFKEFNAVDSVLEGNSMRYLDIEGFEVCVRRYVTIEKDKVFVRGLPQGSSKEDIFAYFKQFGRISSVTLHQNKTGTYPFAFVRFAKVKAVNQIMARNDHMIKGKAIHCLRAHRQEK